MTITLSPDEIQLSAPVNLRDLGGIPVAGGTVAHGFAIRADDLTTIPAASAQELVDAGLTAVIDLRSRGEVEATGRGALQQHAVTYHHIPFVTDLSSNKAPQSKPGTMPNMTAFYPALFTSAAPQIVAALAVLAHAQGTVAFHCAAGRDRTGVLAAALLLALGAEDEAIITDYERTHPNTEAIMERTRPNLRRVMLAAGFDLDAAAKLATQQPGADDAMRVTLTTLRAQYGDPLAPLKSAGLSDSLIGQLHERAGV
ncbi:protein-tyrosine phosphatase [Leucobacter exalbidus]|uniref:Protein-tyrosine phosphatase n=1 Tax=Leucobacter exalbidus TaxID=662960 RepID=A0A940T726_9MICO|nr:tyrosine-protein phosphatase [Leucobacter exalbidus]MBP1327586.1 protein-tyrosine phosphatase [Leucobacter exalbidus]